VSKNKNKANDKNASTLRNWKATTKCNLAIAGDWKLEYHSLTGKTRTGRGS